MPLATRFNGIAGVKDFYQTITASFPDFQITVAREYDTPGCSIREVLINGTHLGEYGGVSASGNRVAFELAGFFLFGSGGNAGKLVSAPGMVLIADTGKKASPDHVLVTRIFAAIALPVAPSRSAPRITAGCVLAFALKRTQWQKQTARA
jgi:hypothetical protein